MRRCLTLLLLANACFCAKANYANDPRATPLYLRLQQEYAFSSADLVQVRGELAQAQRLPQLIPTEQNNKERTSTWDDYRPIHVNPANVANGLAFMHAQQLWLARAEAEFGVPPQVITALIGVETKYGAYTGKFRTLDSLSTLGFEHPRRADFFMNELVQFFVLCRRDGIDALTIRGSYAGALGEAQFMPSNYLKLAIDYDHDGKIDLWSAPDAIGSIANYLNHYRPENAWRRGQPLDVPARAGDIPAALVRNGSSADSSVAALAAYGITGFPSLPQSMSAGLIELNRRDGAEYRLGLANFYSVMTYNPRVFYAAAVADLAEALVQAEPLSWHPRLRER